MAILFHELPIQNVVIFGGLQNAFRYEVNLEANMNKIGALYIDPDLLMCCTRDTFEKIKCSAAACGTLARLVIWLGVGLLGRLVFGSFRLTVVLSFNIFLGPT